LRNWTTISGIFSQFSAAHAQKRPWLYLGNIDSMRCSTDQAALAARLAVLSFITRNTDDVVASRYEATGANLLLTDDTDETFGVPLSSTVLILLHAYITAVTASTHHQ